MTSSPRFSRFVQSQLEPPYCYPSSQPWELPNSTTPLYPSTPAHFGAPATQTYRSPGPPLAPNAYSLPYPHNSSNSQHRERRAPCIEENILRQSPITSRDHYSRRDRNDDTASRANSKTQGEENDELAGIDPRIANVLPGPEKRPNEEYYPQPHHQAQFIQLKRNGHFEDDYSLNSLADGDPGSRPRYKHETIVKCAILGSPRKRLTLNEIYEAIERRFSYFRDVENKKSWKGSIRHMLSLKSQFVQEDRPVTEPGRGNYWTINSNERGNKRDRKRVRQPSQRALPLKARETQQDCNAGHSSFHDTRAGISTGKSSQIATIPANAGSYASVTGVASNGIQALPSLNFHRPWRGVQTLTSSQVYKPQESDNPGRRAYRRADVERHQPYRLASGSHRP